MVQGDHGPIGNHVVGHATLDSNHLQSLTKVATVDRHPAALVGGDRGEHGGQAVDGILAPPGPSGVRPGAGETHLDPHRALAAGLDAGRGGLGQQGGVGRQQVGSLPEEPFDAVEPGVDLLALVEHVGGVHHRLGDGAGQLGQDGDAALHVARTQPPQNIAVNAGPLIAVGRHRVGVAGQQQSRRTTQRRARHQIVADAGDREPRHWSKDGLQEIGHLPLVMTHGRDIDQLGRQLEEIGHITRPRRAGGGASRAFPCRGVHPPPTGGSRARMGGRTRPRHRYGGGWR